MLFPKVGDFHRVILCNGLPSYKGPGGGEHGVEGGAVRLPRPAGANGIQDGRLGLLPDTSAPSQR
eukprot:5475540-Pyramimonas_sp.AAC.3